MEPYMYIAGAHIMSEIMGSRALKSFMRAISFISYGNRRLDLCTDKIDAIHNQKLKTKSKPRENEWKNVEWENFEI